jgi:hypothetical protein
MLQIHLLSKLNIHNIKKSVLKLIIKTIALLNPENQLPNLIIILINCIKIFKIHNLNFINVANQSWVNMKIDFIMKLENISKRVQKENQEYKNLA